MKTQKKLKKKAYSQEKHPTNDLNELSIQIKNKASHLLSESQRISRAGMDHVKNMIGKTAAHQAAWISALSVDELQTELTRFVSEITKKTLGSTPTTYDKAMDGVYIATSADGNQHRLFDGSHDIFGAWEQIRLSHPSDSIFSSVVGQASAMTKDFVTAMGLPVVSLDRDYFAKLVDSFAWIPGVDRSYLYDMATINAAELTLGSLSAIGLLLSFQNKDYSAVSSILGAMGISSLASANPLLGLVTVVSVAYAYKGGLLTFKNLAEGASSSVLSLLVFSTLGFSFLIELAILIFISKQIRSNLIENPDVQRWILALLRKLPPSESDLCNSLKKRAAV